MRAEHGHRSSFTPHRSEYLWVLAFAAAVMLLTTVPYLVGWSVQNEDWRFTGFVISVEDGNGFVAKMRAGAAGDWLFRTPYTASPQRGLLIFLPYLLLGKLVSPAGAHGALVAIYHGFRFVAGVLAIAATYAFLSLFVSNVRYRRLGLALSTLGGGLGWLLILLDRQNWLGSLPLDFYSPETFGFLSLYAYPHYALARALLLWSLVAFLRATARLDETPSIARAGLKIGVLWLLTGLAQPLTGMVVGAVVGIYLAGLAAWQGCRHLQRRETAWPKWWQRTQLAAWAGMVPAPFILYNLTSARLDPYVQAWTAQSLFASPHPLHYVLAYGLLLPFVVVGGIRLWRRGDWTAKFPVAWAVALPILAYAPIGIQRRLPEGIWVALVALAMAGLEAREHRKLRRAGAVLVLTLPSTALLLLGGATAALNPAEPLFRPADEVAAFHYLAQKTSRDTVVLSSYETGNALPAWAPLFVVIGHGPESVGGKALRRDVADFYQVDTPDSIKIDFLQELGVDYVYWGPKEQKLGDWDPRTAPFLSLIYQDERYAILAVEADARLALLGDTQSVGGRTR